MNDIVGAPVGNGKKKKKFWAAGLILALGIGGFAVYYGIENSKTYEVTIENGTEKEDNGGIYHKGNLVTVVADAPDGENMEFSRWLTDGIELSEEEQKSTELTFSMPKENVSLKALYKWKTEVTTIKGGDVSGINYMGKESDEDLSGDITLTPVQNRPDTWQGYYISEPCTDTIYIGSGREGYQLVDVNKGSLTDTVYRWLEVQDGWVIAQDMDTMSWGALTMDGEEVVPFEYDAVTAQGQWLMATNVSGGFTIYHIDGDTCTSAVFQADEVGSPSAAEDDRLIITNSKTEKCILFDPEFNILDTVDSEEMVYLLSGYSENNGEKSDSEKYTITENAARMMSKSAVLTKWKKMVENGYAPQSFYNAYFDFVSVGTVSQDSQLQGVADKKGELIVPIEYDEILTGTEKESSGYFLVVKDGKAGYIRKDGEVTVKPDTYVFSWNEDGEAPAGENIVSYEKMGFIYREANKSYTLVAADGTITTGFQEKPEDLEVYLGGNRYEYISLWKVTDDNGGESLIDWHGNVVYHATDGIDTRNIKVSANRKILFLQNPMDPYIPYVLNTPVM